MNTQSWWMRSYYQKLGLETDLHRSANVAWLIVLLSTYNSVLSNVNQVQDVLHVFKCIPYTACGHYCCGHPSSWTPSWFIARTLMARCWTQILIKRFDRLNRFPSFPCVFVLPRHLFDAFVSPPWSADWVSWTPRWSCSRIDSRRFVPVSSSFLSKNFLKPIHDYRRSDCSTIHFLKCTKETRLQWRQSKGSYWHHGVTRDSTEPSS